MKSKLIPLAAVLCIGSFYTENVIAVPINWITPTGGSFDDFFNWDSGTVPGPTDDPVFDLPTSYTVTFPTAPLTGPLSVNDGEITFALDGNSYEVTGAADIGGSLAVDNGSLNVGLNVNVISGGTLSGSGIIASDGLLISQGGQLGGTLTLMSLVPGGAAVVNSGTVAPGDLVGILSINDGDYQQNVSGVLEIEVGGLTAGSQYDQLSLPTGNAMLAGRLEVPFISGYTPAVGHNITFLPAASVSGSFDSLSLPDYLSSPVAVQIVYQPTSAALSFVAPTMVSSASISPTSLWGNASTWSGDVPITSDVVDMINSSPTATRIDLDVGTQASQRAFAHVVNISSLTPDTNTLGIPTGTSLSAINRVAVGTNGIVEISGGEIFTNLVQVDVGGMVAGNGTIAGDVILGNGLGGGEATLHPSSPGSAAGVINAENLTINSDGVLAIAIEDLSSFGQVVVEQTTTQGGRLVIDASNYTAPLGAQFNVMVSGSIAGNFDSVETVGSSTVFFTRPPAPPLAALGGGNFNVQAFSIGDMNLDGEVDSDDAPDFVLGLLDPLQYWATHGFMFPVQAGNFFPGSSFDFDDIEGFTNAVEGLVAADIFALIEQMSVPEPSTGGLMLVAFGLLGTTGSRRPNRSSRRSN